ASTAGAAEDEEQRDEPPPGAGVHGPRPSNGHAGESPGDDRLPAGTGEFAAPPGASRLGDATAFSDPGLQGRPSTSRMKRRFWLPRKQELSRASSARPGGP